MPCYSSPRRSFIRSAESERKICPGLCLREWCKLSSLGWSCGSFFARSSIFLSSSCRPVIFCSSGWIVSRCIAEAHTLSPLQRFRWQTMKPVCLRTLLLSSFLRRWYSVVVKRSLPLCWLVCCARTERLAGWTSRFGGRIRLPKTALSFCSWEGTKTCGRSAFGVRTCTIAQTQTRTRYY